MNNDILTARRMFKEKFHGDKNFMTPNVIKYGKINPLMGYEISWGYGMELSGKLQMNYGYNAHNKIYGLTILIGDKRKVYKPYELGLKNVSQMFYSYSEVLEYIEKLRVNFTYQDCLNLINPENSIVE